MNNWQPIETAPKDGTQIITWWPGRGVRIERWLQTEHRDHGKVIYSHEGWSRDSFMIGGAEPSYWMPLPEAPE